MPCLKCGDGVLFAVHLRKIKHALFRPAALRALNSGLYAGPAHCADVNASVCVQALGDLPELMLSFREED